MNIRAIVSVATLSVVVPGFADGNLPSAAEAQVKLEKAIAEKVGGVTVSGATLDQLKQRGQTLVKAINEANANSRLPNGQLDLYPKTSDFTSEDSDDIAGKVFGNSVDYFSCLLDIASKKKADWKPYLDAEVGTITVTGTKEVDKFDADNVLWSVFAGVNFDELKPDFPIMVSSNVDCSKLKASWDGATEADAKIPLLETKTWIGSPLGILGAIIVRKDGSVDYLKADELTLKNIYKGKAFAKGYGSPCFLTPTKKISLK